MALPNRFGRRNVGNFGSMASRSSGGSRSAVRASVASERTKTGHSTLNIGMTRGGFLRGAGAVVGGVAAAGLGLGGVAHAMNPDQTNVVWDETNYRWLVFPTEDPTKDPVNVQWVVDQGGEILLKATKFAGGAGFFHFGTTGNDSYIDFGREGNDVIIYGEAGSVPLPDLFENQPLQGIDEGGRLSDRTTIYGGGAPSYEPPVAAYSVFRSAIPNPPDQYGNPTGVNIEISNIRFDSFNDGAVGMESCREHTFLEGCIFSNPIHAFNLFTGPTVWPVVFENFGNYPWIFGTQTFLNGEVKIAGCQFWQDYICQDGANIVLGVFDSSSVTKVTVSNNEIHAKNPWHPGCGRAMFIASLPNATCYIGTNDTFGAAPNWISASDGIQVIDHGFGGGPVKEAYVWNNELHDVIGAGVWLENYTHPNQTPVVKSNKINLLPTVAEDEPSQGIFVSGSNNYIQGNIITGTCDFGCHIMSGSSGNQFIGNNTALLQTPWLYYFEDDACGNTVKGYTGGKIARVWNWECNDVSGVK